VAIPVGEVYKYVTSVRQTTVGNKSINSGKSQRGGSMADSGEIGKIGWIDTTVDDASGLVQP